MTAPASQVYGFHTVAAFEQQILAVAREIEPNTSKPLSLTPIRERTGFGRDTLQKAREHLRMIGKWPWRNGKYDGHKQNTPKLGAEIDAERRCSFFFPAEVLRLRAAVLSSKLVVQDSWTEQERIRSEDRGGFIDKLHGVNYSEPLTRPAIMHPTEWHRAQPTAREQADREAERRALIRFWVMEWRKIVAKHRKARTNGPR